jgi:hypothetical protein
MNATKFISTKILQQDKMVVKHENLSPKLIYPTSELQESKRIKTKWNSKL